jgi:AcrR family transcriptional regulator
MSNTKENILITALRLFAQNGYEAVSTSTIAGELGMTKSALYKHYKNKQDIFDSIMARMVEIDQVQSKEHGIPIETYDDAPETYQNVSVEEDLEYTKKYFHFWTQDEFGKNFRRMLTLEQFRNPTAKEMYGMVMTNGLFEYTTRMYREWIKEGVVKEDDPELLALEFCGPFYLLISLSDTQSDIGHLENLLDMHIERLLEKSIVKEK